MKTPDDTKKGLECCGEIKAPCEGYPYNMDTLDYDESVTKLHDDALAYIQQLEAIVNRTADHSESYQKIIIALVEKIKQLEQERDAAIAEIGRDCETCKHHEACHSPVFCDECGYCGSERYVCCTCEDLDKWEWRGVCEENSKEE